MKRPIRHYIESFAYAGMTRQQASLTVAAYVLWGICFARHSATTLWGGLVIYILYGALVAAGVDMRPQWQKRRDRQKNRAE